MTDDLRMRAEALLGIDAQRVSTVPTADVQALVRELLHHPDAGCELALRESEARFRAVLESSTDCILVWDRDYNYLFANQAAIDHVGTTRERVIGHNMRDGLSHVPDFMRLWMERVDRVFATGEGFRVEDAVNVNGRFVYSESQLSPIRDHAGHVFAVGVVYRDVSDRKRAEQALQRSEARLNAVIEQLSEGAIIATDKEQLIYWNPAAMQMHGVARAEEAVGPLQAREAMYELWTPDGGRRIDPSDWPMRRIRREERINGVELRLRRIDQGWEKTLLYSGCMIETPGGERLIFLSVSDLTEQRQAEAELRASEHRFRALADAMPQLVWTARADGTVEYYNSRAADYLGIRQERRGTGPGSPCCTTTTRRAPSRRGRRRLPPGRRTRSSTASA